VLVNRVANSQQTLGIGRRATVVLWMRNCLEYVIADLAIAKVGAIRVPFNEYLGDDEVRFRIKDCDAQILIVEEGFRDRLTAILHSEGTVVPVIEIGSRDATDAMGWSSLLDASSDRPRVDVDQTDAAAVMYTGGTTGRSKGVVHTQASVVAAAQGGIIDWDIGEEDVLMHVTPLPHGSGFMCLAGLLRGARNVVVRGFEAGDVLAVIEQQSITWTFLVPSMLYMLLDSPAIDVRDTSSIRTIIYGAAPMASTRVEQALHAFGPVLAQGYALIEAMMMGTLLRKEDHTAALESGSGRLASCGRPVLISSVRIVADSGQDVPVGEVGEIILKGPNVMLEYWNDPDATARTKIDGWIHTGDLAYMDDEHFVFIVDRRNDVIITGGMNVYSARVEDVLFSHPAVREAAVFATPHEKWGEAVTAHVVLHTGAKLDQSELVQFCRERLASYETPKEISFVDALPKTAYGKYDKKALRASAVR
jgi:acyl-CoA synthetase (AMP-forming)/AMP-acid ligase II